MNPIPNPTPNRNPRSIEQADCHLILAALEAQGHLPPGGNTTFRHGCKTDGSHPALVDSVTFSAIIGENGANVMVHGVIHNGQAMILGMFDLIAGWPSISISMQALATEMQEQHKRDNPVTLSTKL